MILDTTGRSGGGAEAGLPPGRWFEPLIGELIDGRPSPYLRVVPEPGTLVPLIGGALGLPACAWREYRWSCVATR